MKFAADQLVDSYSHTSTILHTNPKSEAKSVPTLVAYVRMTTKNEIEH